MPGKSYRLLASVCLLACSLVPSLTDSVTSCRRCMRVINQNDPVIKEYNITSEALDPKPVEGKCKIESCGVFEFDSCWQIVLEVTPTASVHVHNCGTSSMSDERVCALLQHGAGQNVSCSVNRCKMGDCESVGDIITTIDQDITSDNSVLNEDRQTDITMSETDIEINDTEYYVQNSTATRQFRDGASIDQSNSSPGTLPPALILVLVISLAVK